MCGICGVLEFDRNRLVRRSALKAMNQKIAHRGPDDDGFYINENVGLAMRRLSIIDLSTGRQPITNEIPTATPKPLSIYTSSTPRLREALARDVRVCAVG